MPRDAQRVAAIDIGTNSTRLLVADVEGHNVTEVERQSRVTRLGRGVDLAGHLSAEAVEAVCEAIADYISIYREAGAKTIAAIATSAVRDASNGEAFIAELRERFAISAQVLDGDEEARLTYLGATAERPPPMPTLVTDIGGGSTELVVGTGEQISFHASLQAGVVRHSERHISSDPPTPGELEALATDVRSLIVAAVAEARSGEAAATAIEADAGIAVAGTPTSLAAIELELEPYDPKRVHGHVLTLATIQRLLSQLAAASLKERVEIPGMHPDRAPTIVAGVVILIEAMRTFGLGQIEVSEHDILHGIAISACSE